MFEFDDFREIWSTIKQNKLRTFLTGFSVSWGIFMLIIMLAAGNGLRNGVMHNLDLPILKNRFKEIDLLSANVWHNDTLYVNKEFISGEMQGVFPDHAKINYVNVKSENGRFINDLDMREERKVIVLSPRMAEVLFPGQNALGQYIKAGKLMWQVVGIYNDDEKSNNAPAYIPFTTARSLYNKGYGFSSFSFTLKGVVSKEANEKFEKDFRALMAQLHQFDPTDTNAIGMWNTAESFRMMNNIMNGIALFIWVVGIGTLIAGIVGVSNIMLITVRERTKEFGIRKAIGAKPSSILRLIITESILVTAVFGYIGMLGGIGLTELINSGMEAAGVGENPGQGGTIFLNPTVNLSIALASTLLIVIAGVLAGYFPARKAVSISAIEAMRTE